MFVVEGEGVTTIHDIATGVSSIESELLDVLLIDADNKDSSLGAIFRHNFTFPRHS
jgi:hypothetical protein